MGDTGKFHLETHDSAVSTELGVVDLEFKPGKPGCDSPGHCIVLWRSGAFVPAGAQILMQQHFIMFRFRTRIAHAPADSCAMLSLGA